MINTNERETLDNDINAIEPLFGEWYIDEILAEGSQSSVYRVHTNVEGITAPRYGALKVIPYTSKKKKPDPYREFSKITKRIDGCGNIVQPLQIDIVCINKRKYLVILMPLCKTLDEYYKDKQINVQTVCKIGISICTALEDMKNHGVIHRDIKPENIMVDRNDRFCLNDFNSAVTEDDDQNNLVTTYAYMAPELYKKNHRATFHSDMYSLGLTLYVMLNEGILPTNRYNNKKNAQTRGRLSKPVHGGNSMFEIIRKACSEVPENRYSSFSKLAAELEGVMYNATDSEQWQYISPSKVQSHESSGYVYIYSGKVDWINQYAVTEDICDDTVISNDKSTIFLAKSDPINNRLTPQEWMMIFGVSLIPLLITIFIKGVFNYELLKDPQSYIGEVHILTISMLISLFINQKKIGKITEIVAVILLIVATVYYTLFIIGMYIENFNMSLQLLVAVFLSLISFLLGLLSTIIVR